MTIALARERVKHSGGRIERTVTYTNGDSTEIVEIQRMLKRDAAEIPGRSNGDSTTGHSRWSSPLVSVCVRSYPFVSVSKLLLPSRAERTYHKSSVTRC